MRKTTFILSLMLLALTLSREAATSPLSTRAVFSQSAAQKSDLVDLRELDQLKSLFERDRGKVRLIALLSPT
ncbi:MAG: hypothetical protein AB1631_05675 [Acidobacteriota bacterium]